MVNSSLNSRIGKNAQIKKVIGWYVVKIYMYKNWNIFDLAKHKKIQVYIDPDSDEFVVAELSKCFQGLEDL